MIRFILFAGIVAFLSAIVLTRGVFLYEYLGRYLIKKEEKKKEHINKKYTKKIKKLK